MPGGRLHLSELRRTSLITMVIICQPLKGSNRHNWCLVTYHWIHTTGVRHPGASDADYEFAQPGPRHPRAAPPMAAGYQRDGSNLRAWVEVCSGRVGVASAADCLEHGDRPSGTMIIGSPKPDPPIASASLQKMALHPDTTAPTGVRSVAPARAPKLRGHV